MEIISWGSRVAPPNHLGPRGVIFEALSDFSLKGRETNKTAETLPYWECSCGVSCASMCVSVHQRVYVYAHAHMYASAYVMCMGTGVHMHPCVHKCMCVHAFMCVHCVCDVCMVVPTCVLLAPLSPTKHNKDSAEIPLERKSWVVKELNLRVRKTNLEHILSKFFPLPASPPRTIHCFLTSGSSL